MQVKYTQNTSRRLARGVYNSIFYRSQSLQGHFAHLLQVSLVLLDFLFS